MNKNYETQSDDKVEVGDIVRTITRDPDSTFLEFEVLDIVSYHGNTMAISERYGNINIDLLTLKQKGNASKNI